MRTYGRYGRNNIGRPKKKNSTSNAFLIFLIMQMRKYRDAFLVPQMVLVKNDFLIGMVQF